jgi:biopolymer transport protein ExbB/TolQ
MEDANRELVERIMALPILQAEWVLWFLFALSVLSLAIIVERVVFLWRRRADLKLVQKRLHPMLSLDARSEALSLLRATDSMETNVLARALGAAERGPEAVEELVRAAVSEERQRYERALPILAVVGSNAPFIGLFGTVLGIIRAFRDLAGGAAASQGSSEAVMSGVSEALVATAVGLLVAIPAVAAFNMLKSRVKSRVERADQLVRTLLAELKSDVRPLAEPAE